MKIEWTEYDHDPGYFHAVVDGVALGHISFASSGWYAKHGTVTRMKLGLPDRAAAEAELEKMILEYEVSAAAKEPADRPPVPVRSLAAIAKWKKSVARTPVFPMVPSRPPVDQFDAVRVALSYADHDLAVCLCVEGAARWLLAGNIDEARRWLKAIDGVIGVDVVGALLDAGAAGSAGVIPNDDTDEAFGPFGEES
jgi:hypothetical protein